MTVTPLGWHTLQPTDQDGLHEARCVCGAKASVVDAEAAEVWAVLHARWPEKHAAELATMAARVNRNPYAPEPSMSMTPQERRKALEEVLDFQGLGDAADMIESWLAEKDTIIRALGEERNRIAREAADVFDELESVTRERDQALRKAAESEQLVYGFMEGVSDEELETRMNTAERRVDLLAEKDAEIERLGRAVVNVNERLDAGAIRHARERADERRRTAEEIKRRADATLAPSSHERTTVARICDEVGGSDDLPVH